MNQTTQYCSFFVADLFFGVEVQLVQEVIRYQEMTRVPLSAREVGCLINLRGQIVTAIDLRRRLKLPDRTDGALPMNVVVRTDEGAVSLLVDEIGDVVDVDASTFESTPATVAGEVRDVITGVHKLDRRLLLLLDTARTLDVNATAVAAVGAD